MKSWVCPVTLRDGRCPDGCCGCVMAGVTSPVTGRVVELDYLAIPRGARGRIVEAVLAGRSAAEVDAEDALGRVRLSGSAVVSLTRDDLVTILANDGACYA